MTSYEDFNLGLEHTHMWLVKAVFGELTSLTAPNGMFPDVHPSVSLTHAP